MQKGQAAIAVFCIFITTKLMVSYYAEAEFTIKIIPEIIPAANPAYEADSIAYAGF